MKRNLPKPKTRAKQAGVKSIIRVNDEIFITSCITNGPKANIEKITNPDGEHLGGKPVMFNTSINMEDKLYEVASCHFKDLSASLPMPLKINSDYLGAKEKLEERIFGKTFPNDNLHIQIAYNVLDIKKIISLYINNIIFALFNLNRSISSDYENFNDAVGQIYVFNNYDEQKRYAENKPNELLKLNIIDKLLSRLPRYSSYFGGLFEKENYEDDNDTKILKKKHNYNILRVVSLVRQFCSHDAFKDNNNICNYDSFLFNDNLSSNNSISDLIPVIDSIFGVSLKKTNREFAANAQNNIYILKKIFPGSNEQALINEYYDFAILKSYKTLGFNVRKIRDYIIKNSFNYLLSKDYDCFRSKLYTILTFVLCHYLKTNETFTKNFVEDLRRSKNEEDKENKYINSPLLLDLLPEYSTYFRVAIEAILTENRNHFKNKINNIKVTKGLVDENSISLFAKICYLLTKFLDDKEANELLCSLESKFTNISELCNTYPYKNNYGFTNNYLIFNKSSSIANNIRTILSMSKISIDKSKISDYVIADALKIFNVNQYISLEGKEYDIKEINKKFQISTLNKRHKVNHQARNFIINNVISSKWFIYILKYGNPDVCSALVKNKQVLKFAFDELPEEQIDRYYQVVTGANNTDKISYETKKIQLIDKLRTFSMDDCLQTVDKMDEIQNKNQKIDSKKQMLKSITTLYLTVAFLITKSIVKVNSYFGIAFSSLERDAFVILNKTEKEVENNLLCLTNHYIKKDEFIYEQRKKHFIELKNKYSNKSEFACEFKKYEKQSEKPHYSYRYFKEIIKPNIDRVHREFEIEKVLDVFRNKVVHVNVAGNLYRYISEAKINSYYGLYCYVLQRLIIDECLQQNKISDKTKNYLITVKENLLSNGTFNKDFMWLLNTPFAYNLGRYKNLSNEFIFYDYFQKDDSLPRQ